jgi:hypothetical protein
LFDLDSGTVVAKTFSAIFVFWKLVPNIQLSF